MHRGHLDVELLVLVPLLPDVERFAAEDFELDNLVFSEPASEDLTVVLAVDTAKLGDSAGVATLCKRHLITHNGIFSLNIHER